MILKIHANHGDFFNTLYQEVAKLLPEINACGSAVFYNNQLTIIKKTPSPSVIHKIVELTISQTKHFTEVSKNMAKALNIAPEELGGCCGFLSLRIPDMGNSCFLFFRTEYQDQIKWAGNPQNTWSDANSHQKLTPRVSFELFLEEISGQAKPWKDREIQLVTQFLSKLKDEIILFQGGELKTTTSILEAIYDNSMDALFVVDLDSEKIIDCNQQAALFFGFAEKQDLLGRISWDFRATPLTPEKLKEKKDVLREGRSFAQEVKYRTSTGKIRWGNYQAKPINVPGKNLYVVRIIDITSKKEVEKKLIKNNQDLQKLNEELDRFVYSSSHDLRAPISSMLGLIGLIEKMDDPKQIIELLDKGKSSLKRLDAFISDILDYSRNSRMAVNLKEVQLHQLIEGVLNNYQFMHTENPVNILIDIPAGKQVCTDEYRLKVILNNIISNAFKYRNPYITDSFVKVSFIGAGQKWCVTIEDNGIGIREEHLTKIFDMFHQADNFKSGSGLGLYIASEMIKKLNGIISVESVVNKGSKFTICFPEKPLNNQSE